MRYLRALASALVLTLALAACTGEVQLRGGLVDGERDGGELPQGDVDANVPPGTPDADVPPGTPDAAVPPGTPDAAVGSCENIVGTRAEQVCLRWSCARRDLDEGGWTGSVGACDAGDVIDGGRERALALVNLYRFMADLPPVTTDTNKNARAQKCALMMHANDSLSHAPPMSWTCYSADGASGAGTSNIASGPGVMAVDMYMNDFGNDTTMGHRRWLLSNSLGPMGLGSTSSASCALVIGGQGRAGKAWMAWPPPGPVPLAAFTAGGFGRSIDSTGWTVQSDSIDLDGAGVSVTVTDGGEARPVTVNTLGRNYGSKTAIRFVANGWSAQAGHTYHVKVNGVSAPIEYDVEVVACP